MISELLKQQHLVPPLMTCTANWFPNWDFYCLRAQTEQGCVSASRGSSLSRLFIIGSMNFRSWKIVMAYEILHSSVLFSYQGWKLWGVRHGRDHKYGGFCREPGTILELPNICEIWQLYINRLSWNLPQTADAIQRMNAVRMAFAGGALGALVSTSR